MNFVVTQRFAGRGHQEEAGPEGAPGARHLREQALPPLRAQHTGQGQGRTRPKVADLAVLVQV